MTGYALHKEFQSSVGHVWHAPDSQIYPELRRMEKDGLLEGEDVAWGQRGTKRLYHITPAGEESLRIWANSTMEYARVRDPAHLKAAYLEWADPDAAREQMNAHIRHHAEQLEQWQGKLQEIQSGTSAMLNRRLARTPEADRRRTTEFKIFAYEGLIARAQTEIEWAQRGLALIDTLDRPS